MLETTGVVKEVDSMKIILHDGRNTEVPNQPNAGTRTFGVAQILGIDTATISEVVDRRR